MAKTITVRIAGDATGVNTAFRQAETAGETFSRKMEAIGDKMKTIGRSMTIGITLPVVAGFTFAFNAASDLNETISKTKVVFGDSAKAIMDWSRRTADTLGMSRNESLTAASALGLVFTQVGMNADAAATMSMSWVTLAGDLASFNNADPSEVLAAITAATRGEYDALQQYVPMINAATVEEKARAMGLADSNGEISAQAKVQAINALMFEQTTAAQGDFARTADGAANAQRRATAKFKDAAAVLGKQLLPIGQKLIEWVTKAVEWFNKLSPKTQKFTLIALGLAAVLGPLLIVLGSIATAVAAISLPVVLVVLGIAALVATVVLLWKHWDTIWNWIKDHPALGALIAIVLSIVTFGILPLIVGAIFLAKNWDTVWSGIKAVVEAVWNFLAPFIDASMKIIQGIIKTVTSLISGDWSGAWEGIKQTLAGAWDYLAATVRAGIDLVKLIVRYGMDNVGSVINGIGNVIGGVADAIANPFRVAFGNIKSLWNSTVGGFRFEIPSWVPGVGGKGFSIPTMHTGGIVPGLPGSEMLAILQAGERVTPAGAASFGAGAQFNFVTNASAQDIAEELAWLSKTAGV